MKIEADTEALELDNKEVHMNTIKKVLKESTGVIIIMFLIFITTNIFKPTDVHSYFIGVSIGAMTIIIFDAWNRYIYNNK